MHKPPKPMTPEEARKAFFGAVAFFAFLFFFFWMVFSDRPSQAPKTTEATKDLELCGDRGAAAATAYMANIRSAARTGLSATELMNMACSSTSSRCQSMCESGFRVEARRVIN
ncbi:hypothetical protein J2W96_003545 [Variovorax guangxiensis]|nr:hypothetical protein [Variovorax guangxiensis]